VEDASTPSSSQEWSNEKRRKWIPEEEKEIKRLFVNEIRNQSVTMAIVRKKMKNSPIVKNIPVQKLRDKIRTFFGSVQRELPTLPEETSRDRLTRSGYKAPLAKTTQRNSDSGDEYQPSENATPSIIPPTTCTSKRSSQKLFADNEYEVFYELFKDIIHSSKQISKPLVQKRIEGEPKLRHLLDKYELLQLADKVRTERRILARVGAKKCKYTDSIIGVFKLSIKILSVY
jgi:hypothetical protein